MEINIYRREGYGRDGKRVGYGRMGKEWGMFV
jgi:hypothetical protein